MILDQKQPDALQLDEGESLMAHELTRDTFINDIQRPDMFRVPVPTLLQAIDWAAWKEKL